MVMEHECEIRGNESNKPGTPWYILSRGLVLSLEHELLAQICGLWMDNDVLAVQICSFETQFGVQIEIIDSTNYDSQDDLSGENVRCNGVARLWWSGLGPEWQMRLFMQVV